MNEKCRLRYTQALETKKDITNVNSLLMSERNLSVEVKVQHFVYSMLGVTRTLSAHHQCTTARVWGYTFVPLSTTPNAS